MSRFSRRIALGVALAWTAGIVLTGAAPAEASPMVNPWLDQRGILNMAHQGGEMEAPSSTMYAFRTALHDRGADSLELDVNATADNRLAVIHDSHTRTITREDREVRELTLAELQAFDAAWWFSPGHAQFNHTLPDSAYPLRGVRTGDVNPPAGYRADDFRVPALEEVLAAFPRVPVNIEIKTVPGNPDESLRVATLLAKILNRPESRSRRVIVASTDQAALERFNRRAPLVGVSASLGSMIAFIGTGAPISPWPVALQVPSKLGDLDLPWKLKEMNVNGKGHAVHAWTENLAAENDGVYRHLIASGVQGIMSSAPQRLGRYLCKAGVRRPDGSPRCDAQRLRYRLRLPSRSLKAFVRRGFPVRSSCSARCTVRVELRLRKRTARRLGIRRKPVRGLVPIGKKRAVLPARKSKLLRVKAPRKARPKLKKMRGLKVQLTTVVFDHTGWQVDRPGRTWLKLR